MAVHVVDHPLVRHKLGILRKDSTSTSEFRSVSNEIARLLIYEATKGFATEKHTVQGWAGPVEVEAISGQDGDHRPHPACRSGPHGRCAGHDPRRQDQRGGPVPQ